MAISNFYIVLGLQRAATADQIRRAYRRLARKYHPDINPGDRAAAELFRQITEAYETLADPERRRQYDEHEPGGPRQVTSPFEFTGFDFSVHVDGRQASTFGELFTEVAAGMAPAPPERGVDLHAAITISFEESVHGTERTLTVTRLERCAPCGGRGMSRGPEMPCRACDGTGHLRGARGHMVFSRLCGGCGGSGVVHHWLCPACGGEGVGVRGDVVRVNVPAGVSDGGHFSVPGHGHAGRRGGPPGDLRVSVTVLPHAHFRREGDDLHLEVPIAVHEAALGARIDVPSLDGPARLRIPAGTQSGQTFRLRERGLPNPRLGRRGDLLVTVRLVLPRVLDERSKELMAEFGRINAENVRQELEHPSSGSK
jgi:molecular chaperone DnaJ